jgi:L-ascorbate metabolism protein UlaG (beta-lactamase superfamily)
MTSSFKYGNTEVVFLKHAGFKVKGSKTIYIDPYDIPEGADLEKADYIFVTHDHFDHLDFKAIKKLSTEKTTVVIPQGCSVEGHSTCTLELGRKEKLDGIVVETVPAYNIDKKFHPKGQYVGYIIEMDGVRIYHAGDTDYTPEMKNVNADIALIPVGGTYTMDIEDAKKAVSEMNVKHVIPMHYGAIPDTEADVSKLESDKVVVLKPMF